MGWMGIAIGIVMIVFAVTHDSGVAMILGGVLMLAGAVLLKWEK
jgi:hypothetical protein